MAAHPALRPRSRVRRASVPALKAQAAGGAQTGVSRAAARRPVLRLRPEQVRKGGLRIGEEPGASVANLRELLATDFMDVALDACEGARLLNVDPPVLVVDDFLSDELCAQLVGDAVASDRMVQSRVGGDGDSNLRTSRTLALTSAPLEDHPAKLEVQRRAAALLPEIELLPSDPNRYQKPVVDSASERARYAFELPQVAHYRPGEFFKPHEDAFPFAAVTGEKRYQRRATLLVYLNDVPEGGATAFTHLELGVRPKRGMALLFFPSFRNGRPDPRTLHEAEAVPIDAEGAEKFIFQLWIASSVNVQATAKTPGGEARASHEEATKRPAPRKAPAKKKKTRGFG